MRLFLLPISHRHTLIYAQRINRTLTTEQTYVEKITTKATTKWAQWEVAEKGWQKKVTEWGNSAFARIPFQEWGLKSVPPLSARRKNDELQGKDRISLRFPQDIVKPNDVLALLRKLATERQALHRKQMWWSIVGLPIALPFGLLPVIPNLPFFYLTFRAWSHWRALNGSKHIEYLLDRDLIHPSPSMVLQKVYDIGNVSQEKLKLLKDAQGEDIGDPAREDAIMHILSDVEPNWSSHGPPAGSTDKVLLPKGAGKFVARAIGVPTLDVEIERAVVQVERIIVKDDKELKEKEEKREQDSKNK